MVSCAQVLRLLSEFVDQDIDVGLGAEIEAHLAMCRRCSVLYDTLRKVLVIATDECIFEVPADYSERLHAFINEHL